MPPYDDRLFVPPAPLARVVVAIQSASGASRTYRC